MGKVALAIAIAAAGLAAAPAAAGGSGQASSNGYGNGHVGGFVGGEFQRVDDKRFDRRGGEIGTWVNGGQWALYNNQSFRSDGFNDWWHDRPDRAYPAWMRNNQSCRLYWSGGAWRC